MSNHLPADKRAEVERLLHAGSSVRHIHAETGVAKQTISTLRYRLGMQNAAPSPTVSAPVAAALSPDTLVVELPMQHPDWNPKAPGVKAGIVERSSLTVEGESMAKIAAALEPLTTISRAMVWSLIRDQLRDEAGDAASSLRHYAFLMDHVARALEKKATAVDAEMAKAHASP